MAKANIPVGNLNDATNNGTKGASNSPTTEKRHVQASITKKSLGDKFSETFVKEDMKSVGEYLLKEKIFPDLISMVRDTIWDAITMHFGLGGSRGGYGYGNPTSKQGYTNYQAASASSYAYGGKVTNGQSEKKPTRAQGPTSFRDISYGSDKDAEYVLASMRHDAKQYDRGSVSVAELYEYSDLTCNSFTDNNWGWRLEMLENVPIKRVMVNGELRYVIDFPNPVPID